jgi:Phage integrase family
VRDRLANFNPNDSPPPERSAFWRCRRSITAVALCSSAAARADATARSAWTNGVGKNGPGGSDCASSSPSVPFSVSSMVRPAAGRGQAPARAELRRTADAAGVRRRFAPHQLRHAHAVEMAHEGVPLVVIQRQLGHSKLGITSIYLLGSWSEPRPYVDGDRRRAAGVDGVDDLGVDRLRQARAPPGCASPRARESRSTRGVADRVPGHPRRA